MNFKIFYIYLGIWYLRPYHFSLNTFERLFHECSANLGALFALKDDPAIQSLGKTIVIKEIATEEDCYHWRTKDNYRRRKMF